MSHLIVAHETRTMPVGLRTNLCKMAQPPDTLRSNAVEPRPRLRTESIDGTLKSMLVLARTIDRVFEMRAVETAVDESMSSSKVQLLRLLGTRGAQTPGQVARFIGVSRPAVTQLIDSLVRDGLVSRRDTPQDGRKVFVNLTKRGNETFTAVRRTQRHLLRNALRLSDSNAVDRWKATMFEIAGAVAQADNAFEHFCLQCGAHADGTCVLVGGDTDCLFLQNSNTTVRRAARRSPGRGA